MISEQGPAAKPNPVQEAEKKAKDPVRSLGTDGKEKDDADERGIGQDTQKSQKRKIAYICLEKPKLRTDEKQSVQHHDNLVGKRFHGDNGARFSSIHTHFPHGINLHGLPPC